MFPQFLNDGLNTKHQKLVPQMESEFKIFCPGSVIEDRVDKGHDGSLKEAKNEMARVMREEKEARMKKNQELREQAEKRRAAEKKPEELPGRKVQ